MNYAVSNIISSIVYGSRFEYSDPQFKEMVNRANENVRIGGSASMRVSNDKSFLDIWKEKSDFSKFCSQVDGLICMNLYAVYEIIRQKLMACINL